MAAYEWLSRLPTTDWRAVFSRKFMVAFEDSVLEKLREAARRRDISIQELFRALIIPDWVSSPIRQTYMDYPEVKNNGEN